MKPVTKPLWTLLALAFLLEAWTWDTVGPAVGRLVALLPFARLKDGIHRLIARLPPFLTLFVFAIPFVVLLPFKMATFWLMANGHFVVGVAAFLLAKTVGLGTSAFLFEACRPNLMRMAWFAAAYGKVMAAKAWAHRMADPYLASARKSLAEAGAAVAGWLPSGRGGRRIRLIRSRMARRA